MTSEEPVEEYLRSDAWTMSETPMILRILLVSHSVRSDIILVYLRLMQIPRHWQL